MAVTKGVTVSSLGHLENYLRDGDKTINSIVKELGVTRNRAFQLIDILSESVCYKGLMVYEYDKTVDGKHRIFIGIYEK